MKPIYVKEFLIPLWEKNVKEGRPRNYLDKDEYMAAFLKRLNEECSKGYRLGTIIYDQHYDDGGVIFLCEDAKGWTYKVTQFDDVRDGIGRLVRDKKPLNDALITTIYTDAGKQYGELHSSLIITNISKMPFYFFGVPVELEQVKQDDNTGKTETTDMGPTQGSGKKASRSAK
jgi:hypothetical protein